MNTRVVGALPLACLVIASGCAVPEAQLEGSWVGHEVGGGSGECSLVIVGNRLECTGRDGREWYKGTLILNESSDPHEMDIQIDECSAAQYNGKVGLAIYEVTGTTLRVAGSEPGVTARPTSFDQPDSRTVRIFTFNRR